MLRLIKCLFRSLLILAVIYINTSISFAAQLGDPVPNSGIYSKVLPGEVVPVLEHLKDSSDVKVKFNKKPTVIVAIHGFIDIEKLWAIQDYYEKNKNVMDLYLFSNMNSEQMDFFVKKYNIRVPYFANTTEFTQKFNRSALALIIIDQNGKVRYNSEYNIDMEAFKQYMDRVITGRLKEEPHFTYVPPKVMSSVPLPPLLNIGDKINLDDFQSVDGESIHVKGDKPLVLWFCLSVSSPKDFQMTLPILESLKTIRGNTVDAYPVFDGGDSASISELLQKHKYSLPTLKNAKFIAHLAYARAFPCIVIFDKQGVLRYRSIDRLSLEDLENIIDGLN